MDWYAFWRHEFKIPHSQSEGKQIQTLNTWKNRNCGIGAWYQMVHSFHKFAMFHEPGTLHQPQSAPHFYSGKDRDKYSPEETGWPHQTHTFHKSAGPTNKASYTGCSSNRPKLPSWLKENPNLKIKATKYGQTLDPKTRTHFFYFYTFFTFLFTFNYFFFINT